MTGLTYITTVTIPGAAEWSRLSDLAVVRTGSQDRLVATSNYDGRLVSFNINGVAPARLDQIDHLDGLRAGGTGWIVPVSVTGGGPQLVTGGATGGALRLVDLASDGTLTAGAALPGTQTQIGALQGAVSVTLENGQHMIYGGLAGGDGIGALRLNADGSLFNTRITPDTGATYAAATSDVAHLRVGGQDYLYATSATEHGLQVWVVANNGTLTRGPGLGVNEDLWIATPTAVETARVGTVDYLVVGAATSGTLSVIRVQNTGALEVTDHMLDTRDTRFGGVTALDVITVDGMTYVVSGGADDGVSLHQLLPQGQLVHLASFADTPAAALSNVAAITTHAKGRELQIFATSATERGITKLTYDLGPLGAVLTADQGGETLTGTTGADVITGKGGDDRLSGGAGNDILRDGAGRDTLTGGAGADVFIFAYDDTPDVIMDFTPGEDRIDLSGWPMVRAKTQLTLEITATGFTVTYGDEFLDVRSADGQLIDHRTLLDGDLIGGARIPQVILPGFPGPYTRPPDLPGRPNGPAERREPVALTVTIDGISFRNPQAPGRDGMVLKGGKGDDRLKGSAKADRIDGRKGDDMLKGGAGRDRLEGGPGADRIEGGKDDDRLMGGGGRDQIWGGPSEDRLIGGGAVDRLRGGGSDDMLFGGGGNDRIWGGGGRDRLDGGNGRDDLRGGGREDLLAGGVAADRLEGGKGDDVAYGGGAGDRVVGGPGRDALYGGGGSDRLFGGGGSDRLEGGGGTDRLVGGGAGDDLRGGKHDDALYGGSGDDGLRGEAGNDQLYGGTGNDVLEGGDGNDTLRGDSGDDILRGDTGVDTLAGGVGNDSLTGGTGADRLLGEDGNDTLDGGRDNDRLYGGTGNDRLLGDHGNDLLYGGDGNDRLFGGAGSNSLWGGNGNDTLEGGTGNDVMAGGAGADRFVFTGGRDRVVDFDQARDMIAVDTTLWSGTLTGGELVLLYGQLSGSTATLTLPDGDRLEINGVTDYATLGDALEVF